MRGPTRSRSPTRRSRTTWRRSRSGRSATARSATRTARWSWTARSSSSPTTTASRSPATTRTWTGPRRSRPTAAWTSTIEDITAATPHLQVQGPKSREILAPITEGTDLDPAALLPLRAGGVKVGGVPCMVSRTGYSGELGYELYCSPTTRRRSGTRCSRPAGRRGCCRSGCRRSRRCGSSRGCCSRTSTTSRSDRSVRGAPGQRGQARQAGRLRRQGRAASGSPPRAPRDC